MLSKIINNLQPIDSGKNFILSDAIDPNDYILSLKRTVINFILQMIQEGANSPKLVVPYNVSAIYLHQAYDIINHWYH